MEDLEGLHCMNMPLGCGTKPKASLRSPKHQQAQGTGGLENGNERGGEGRGGVPIPPPLFYYLSRVTFPATIHETPPVKDLLRTTYTFARWKPRRFQLPCLLKKRHSTRKLQHHCLHFEHLLSSARSNNRWREKERKTALR